jgi:hypothetical protein
MRTRNPQESRVDNLGIGSRIHWPSASLMSAWSTPRHTTLTQDTYTTYSSCLNGGDLEKATRWVTGLIGRGNSSLSCYMGYEVCYLLTALIYKCDIVSTTEWSNQNYWRILTGYIEETDRCFEQLYERRMFPFVRVYAGAGRCMLKAKFQGPFLYKVPPVRRGI